MARDHGTNNQHLNSGEHDHTAVARDVVIGQAEGIIMATTYCTAEHAHDLLCAQSQAQHRDADEIAAEIVDRVSRRATI